MKRVVLDCVVFLQAAINENGPAGKCRQVMAENAMILLMSRDILIEIETILNRRSIRQKYVHITDEFVSQYLVKLENECHFVDKVPTVYSLPRDPKDEPYINLAIAAGANYLISRDLDLLDLMQDSQFRQSYPDITICDPVQFLTLLNALP